MFFRRIFNILTNQVTRHTMWYFLFLARQRQYGRTAPLGHLSFLSVWLKNTEHKNDGFSHFQQLFSDIFNVFLETLHRL